MTREEAITTLKEMHDSFDEIHENTNGDIGYEQMTAIDMAIEALSKPNYETDTEVRLAVTNTKKEKVILWDAFGEVEYYPIEALSADVISKDEYVKEWNDITTRWQDEYNKLKNKYDDLCERHFTLKHGMQDAVQVVRCKDCRWYENRYGEVCHNPRYGDGHANYSPPFVNEEYWCKDGERREE